MAPQVFDTLEALVGEGTVAAYGWSTDFMPQALSAVDYPHFVAFENDYNVFTPAEELMRLAEERGKISLSRLPLAMGLLTGKFKPDQALDSDDVRAQAHPWLRFFKDGKPNATYLDADRGAARPSADRRADAGAGCARLDPGALADRAAGARLQDRGAGPRQFRRLRERAPAGGGDGRDRRGAGRVRRGGER